MRPGRGSKASRLGVGIVGCGRAAIGLHLPSLARIPGLEVVAVCDSDPHRLSALGPLAPRPYTDYRELLADPRVEIVLVAVPPARHAEVAVAALAAGKHLLVEKPLALDLGSADRVLDASTAAPGLAAVMGFNLRSHRLLQRARDLVRAGDLGRILALRSTLIGGQTERPAWQRSPADGGGAVIELGSHHFDLWAHLLGAEPQEIRAQRLGGSDGDSAVAVTARVGEATATSLLALEGVATHTLEIVGERGALRFSFYRGDDFDIHPSGRIARALRGVQELPAVAASARRGGDYLDSYRRHWVRFLEHLEGGDSPATLTDGRRSLAAALAALGALQSPLEP